MYFKVFTAGMFILSYFSGVNFFFEEVFPYLKEINPEVTLELVPFLIFFIKLIGQFLIKYKYFKRYDKSVLVVVMLFFTTFDYIYIGTLHAIINKSGITSKTFWFTMIFNLFMELQSKIFLFRRIIFRLRRKVQNNDRLAQFNVSPIFLIYQGIRTEMELYSVLMYFFLILTKYYSFCMTTLVDCKGHPIVSMSEITNEHFVLVIILFLQILFINILKRANKKFCKSYLFQNIKVRFKTQKERIFYILMFIGMTIDFGLPGLYSMMWRE